MQNRSEVTAALDASCASWSKGDLDGFMRLYDGGPHTSYVSGGQFVQGFDKIRAIYAARFAGGADGMGHLSMAVQDYRGLGPNLALVTGRFSLRRPTQIGGDAAGIFTLVMQRQDHLWRIISDHTS